MGLSCQNCLCKIWAQQQGGWHLEVKRTFAGSGDNIDDKNVMLQFRVSKLKKYREDEIFLTSSVNNNQENEDDICYSLLLCRERSYNKKWIQLISSNKG